MSTLATEATALGTTLVDWLRSVCGVDSTALSDLDANIALRTAMQRINSTCPLLGIGSFSTVVGTQKYSPLPAGAYIIRQAWWCDPGLWTPGEDGLTYVAWTNYLGAAFGQPIDDIGTRTALDVSTVDIVLRRQEQVERWIGTNFAVVNNGADIYLGTPPGDVRTVYFSYTGDRFTSVGAVTTPYFDAFWAAATAAALGTLSTGALSIKHVADSQEGTAITLNGGEAAAKRAAAADLKFYRVLATPPVEGWLFE